MAGRNKLGGGEKNGERGERGKEGGEVSHNTATFRGSGGWGVSLTARWWEIGLFSSLEGRKVERRKVGGEWFLTGFPHVSLSRGREGSKSSGYSGKRKPLNKKLWGKKRAKIGFPVVGLGVLLLCKRGDGCGRTGGVYFEGGRGGRGFSGT